MSKLILFNKRNVLKKSALPLVIGFFDGLHKGHALLFKNLQKEKFNILTFINVPNKLNNLLYNDRERIADLQTLYPKNVYLLDLQENNLLTMAFVYKLLNEIKPAQIIVGKDFKFGKQRLGDVKQLQSFFNLKLIDLASKYKTTKIKMLISNGDMQAANKLLISPYTITGIVEHGKGNGSKLGYPTANVTLDKNTLIPKSGSYVGYTYVNEVKYNSAIFIRN
jgi:riboflavin kinase/FMN adenylyltransferase